MDEVVLRIDVHRDGPLQTPWAHTPAGIVTLGFGDDIDTAIRIALSAMLDLLQREFSVDRSEALGLASVAVDMEITQLVNGTVGAHALLPHGAIERA